METHASAGLLSISKIKGPKSQKMRQKRSARDISDNPASVSRQIFCEAFQTNDGSPAIEKWLDKITCTLISMCRKYKAVIYKYLWYFSQGKILDFSVWFNLSTMQ